MALDFIPYELKDFKILERVLISRRILFKKTAIMHAKGEFAKIKGSICNIPIKAADICHILPRPAVSNGLITVKLKRDLKYRGLVYFKPVRRHIVYQALTYLNLMINFMKIYLLKMVSQVKTRLSFLISLKFKDTLSQLLRNMFLVEKKSLKI